MQRTLAEVGIGGIGDVHSTARGSGARFNAGKPPMELVPACLISEFFAGVACTEVQDEARSALYYLGLWQQRCAENDYLRLALSALSADGWYECAQVFDYGKRKYAEWNWVKGMPWSVPFACAVRHLMAILRGETNDPESGLPHRGHVFCNLVMLMTFENTYPEGDDRPPAGTLARVPAEAAAA